MLNKEFDPDIWGPHFWFFLHTIARSYPLRPSSTMQKKYYTFYQDIPIFMPVPSIGNAFAKLLDRFPVSPYLSSRKDLIKWTNFIHNKVNARLMKDKVPLSEGSQIYWSMYKSSNHRAPGPSKVLYLLVGFLIMVTVVISSQGDLLGKMKS
jgi:hypothetical protein